MSNLDQPATKKRLELEQRGLTPMEIKLLDDVQAMLFAAYRAGQKAAEQAAPQSWSNQSCFGYVIMAAEQIGLSEQDTCRMVKAMHRIFDERSLEEAAEHYRQSLY